MRNIVIDGYPFKRYRYEDGVYSYREPSKKEVKEYLVEKYGVCYFCNTEVKLYPQVDGRGTPDDGATIDHLISRNNRKRFEVVEKVLACYKCNGERNREELASIREVA